MSIETRIVAGGRNAGDSLDFYIRHGRELRAQAMRQSLTSMLAWYRSWRRDRASAGREWQVEWPAGPKANRG